MKRLVHWISLLLLLLVAMVLIGPRTAEAGRYRRAARHVHVHHRHYVAPVRVYAPRVGVYVGPGVRVRAPGVRVNIGSAYPLHHAGARYYRW